MDLETIKAIQVICLRNVDEQKYDAWYRSICRWYSKTFCTPLQEVLDMDEHHVLTQHYEEVFLSAKEAATIDETHKQAYEDLKKRVLIDEDEIEVVEEEDEKWAKQINEELKKELSSKIKANVDKVVSEIQGKPLVNIEETPEIPNIDEGFFLGEDTNPDSLE